MTYTYVIIRISSRVSVKNVCNHKSILIRRREMRKWEMENDKISEMLERSGN